MAESEHDPRILQAYRDLGDEAPPPMLDAAILAAARRRAGRWQVPLAAAATLVLAAGVGFLVQREEPRTREKVAIAPQGMPAPAPEAAGGRQALADSARPAVQASGAVPEAVPGRRELLAKAAPPESNAAPTSPPPAPSARAPLTHEARTDPASLAPEERAAQSPSPAAGLRSAGSAEVRRDAAAAGVLGDGSAGKPDSPGAWLQKIAGLRAAGRHAEADQSLAEFRRRYPDYRIPDAMRERVLPP